MQRNPVARYLLLAFILGISPSLPAAATDGVIEINQTRAQAGGVTPGDTAGFPVLLTEAGSYRLTGNLVLTSPDETAIQVTVSSVTIDLNGFDIIGPTTCSGSPPTCSNTGAGRGIQANAASLVTVRNGTIRGMGSDCVYLGFQGRVEGLNILNCGGAGVRTFGIGHVSRNSIRLVGGSGVLTGHSAHVVDNVTVFIGGYGLELGSDCVWGGNLINVTGGAGGDVSIGSQSIQLAPNFCSFQPCP